ncbi:Hypothetical protein CINCED_3A022975 [Cinara cedri]|uniref:Uncharacterized protein n=1 Tax=Cinara cedri TaxID=506608 RepID=A0A5E4MWW6_9HEMI|nr:Hypothetical protein CINCED_3A022975 [Cinara cedri]
MIKNILIINKTLVSLELANKKDLENFIKIFTVFEKHKAASTLFTDEVKIEYAQHNAMEIVKLIKDTSFRYSDIENILNHLSKHGIKATNDIIAYTLIAAYDTALDSRDIVFSLFENSPQFNIKVSKNTFIITPMSKLHLELNSKNSTEFVKLLKDEKSMYDCVVKENSINVIVHSEIHQAINSIVESLIKSNLLEKVEEEKLKARLRQLAFKDQAFVEYSSIKAINKYPHGHSLRKHENVIKGIENILYDFMKNEDSKFAVERLNRLQIAPDTPRIITKTIDKLVKFH